MATVSWAIDAGGDWRTKVDWSTGALPGGADQVVLGTAHAQTIVHSVGGDAIAGLTATTDRLAVSGGSLRVAGTASLAAGLALSGGTLALTGGGTIGGGLTASGGILATGGGSVLAISGPANLGDKTSLTGQGTLATGGATTIGGDGSDFLVGGGVTWSNSGVVSLVGRAVTVNAAHFVNETGARFDLTSDGSAIITSAGASTFSNAGALAKVGGGGTSELDSSLTSTGTVEVSSGTLLLTANAILAGTLSGSGTLELRGMSNQLTSVAATALATLRLDAGTATMLSASVLGSFVIDHASVVARGGSDRVLGGFTQAGGSLYIDSLLNLTLSGTAVIEGGATITGAGTLSTSGTTTAGADGGTLLLSHGTWLNRGRLTLDAAMGTNGDEAFTNASGAGFGFGTDAGGIGVLGGRTIFTNAGTLAKLGGSGISVMDAVLTSTGTILVATGTLELGNGGTISGDIAGGGTLLFGAGQFALAAATTISIVGLAVDGASVSCGGNVTAALSLQSGSLTVAGMLTAASLRATGGVLALQGAGSTVASLELVAATLELSGGANLAVSGAASLTGGTIAGSDSAGAGALITAGTTALAADGAAFVFDDGAGWTNTGTVSAYGAIQCSGTAAIAIIDAAGAAFDLLTDAAGIAAIGTPTSLVNAGTLAKLAGGGTSSVYGALTSTGAIEVATGTLDLVGGGSIGGALSGAGTLLFGGGSFVVLADTAMTVANVAIDAGSVMLGNALGAADFAVSGRFSLDAASAVVAAGGFLSLAGAATFTDGATIRGAATLATLGAVSIAADGSSAWFSDGLSWSNTGVVTALGQIDTGGLAAVAFDNAPGAVFDLGNDTASIFDAGSASSFDNQGSLEKTGGAGTSSLYTVVTSTGTLVAASGTLALEFSAGLAGVAGGVGGGRLLLVNGAGTTGHLTITDDGSAVSVQLSSSYATWTNSGTVADAGQILLGDATDGSPSILYNGGGVWQLTTDDANLVGRGTVWFTNAGTLAKTGGTGRSEVTFGFANAGLVDAASGTLALLGGVGGSGQLRIEPGATLELGTAPASGQGLAMAGAGATLKLDQPASIAGPIQGFGNGESIDLARTAVTGASIAGSQLSVMAGSTVYTFVSSESLAGLQAHVGGDGSGGSVVSLATTSLGLPAMDLLAVSLAADVLQASAALPPPFLPSSCWMLGALPNPTGGPMEPGTWPKQGNAAHWTWPAQH